MSDFQLSLFAITLTKRRVLQPRQFLNGRKWQICNVSNVCFK